MVYAEKKSMPILVIALMAILTTAASAQFTLTTTFAAGNGAAGNMFDIQAVTPVSINDFDVHVSATGMSMVFEVYYKTLRTSYVGSETNAADWTLLASTTAVTAGLGNPTPLNLNLGFLMTPGEKIGFYVTTTGPSVQYTNGTALGALYASDANIQFFEGVGKGYPFGVTNTPRIFNGNIHYGLSGGGFADDLSCSTVDSPSDAAACSTLSNAEVVSFTALNFGSNALTPGSSFTADLIVDGTLITTEAFTTIAGMAQFASEQFTFVTTVDLSSGGSRSIDVVITYGGDQDLSNNTGSLAVDAGTTTDMALSSIDGPLDAVGCNVLGNAESVSFTVANIGANSITIGSSFSATLTLNGSAITTENFTVVNGDILCGGTDTFVFATTVDLSAGGTQNVDVALSYVGDLVASNDTASRAINASGPGGTIVTTFPFVEDFETFGGAAGGLTSPVNNGWVQDPNDSTGTYPDWYFGSTTGSSNSGPETLGLGDHTSGSGRFGFVEDSSATNPVVNLWSPCLDLTGLTNPAMTIWVNAHDYNGGTEFNPVHIDLLTSGGVVTSIASVLADTGNQWLNVSVPLAPYIGQIIQVQIRGTNVNSSFHCDSAIDDFAVFDQIVQSGQAPQPGVATLDINQAVNANTNLVSSGANGPYSTQIASQGTLTMSMTGENLAGIVLIGGPLNVQVATYPGFGQFDIGSLPLNGLGIPSGLVQWADGVTAPVLGLNQFFVCSPTGDATFSSSLPSLPTGTFTTFQTVNTHSTLIIGFSNAVEVVIF